MVIMTTVDKGESSQSNEEASESPADVPVGSPDQITKNPKVLKEANEQMAILDVLVCGQCHSAFHLVEEFTKHKEGKDCTGKSPVRDSNESKAQVWGFLLWKCSLIRDKNETGPENCWILYQQWCRMAEPHRSSWIAAGANVQSLSKFAHAKVMEVKPDDQEVPVQSPSTPIKKGKTKKNAKVEDATSETQPSGEDSDDKPSPVKKQPDKVTNSKKMTITPQLQMKPKHVTFDKDSVRNAQERVPPEERIARRTDRGSGDSGESGEYVVEKILAKRFNPRTKQYEYLLKWEGYPHEQNTWEPMENMETCKHLLDAFEKQLARQKELKALRAAQQQQPHTQNIQIRQFSGGDTQIKQYGKKSAENPTLTPSGRLQRTSKARALDQVKAWCGASEEEPSLKRAKKEITTTSDDEDFTPDDFDKDISPSPPAKVMKVSENKPNKVVNGQSPIKAATIDPELVKTLGLGGKGMPHIKGVIKVDPKHMPSLTTGVYIMSKSSGIMKIGSPGKLGLGLNIDQEAIKKQIMAAKQANQKKKQEPDSTKATASQASKNLQAVKRPSHVGSPQVTEKTIITPSGQKIIQRTIQRPTNQPAGKSPLTILNKKLQQTTNDNSVLLRRMGSTPRGGRGGRGGISIATAAGNIVRIREQQKSNSFTLEFDKSDSSSDTSDGIEDPFPKDLGPIPELSPERELSLCPLTGKRLARAEGEPTPPPTPSPPPTPPPPPATPSSAPLLMKVEMSPGGTTGMLVQGEGAQPSLPVLTDDESAVKVEASAVKQLLEEGVGVDEGEEVGLLYSAHQPIMIRGEDGVLYQVAGENEAGQTLLVAAEGVEGSVEGVEGMESAVEGNAEGDGEGVMFVKREDGQDVLTIDPAQLAQLMPGGEAVPALQQVAVQVEGEPGEEATQVIAQLVQAELPSPGGTRRVILLLPDGSFTMTELDKEQYESITEASKAQE